LAIQKQSKDKDKLHNKELTKRIILPKEKIFTLLFQKKKGKRNLLFEDSNMLLVYSIMNGLQYIT
jgi:predicted dithiol-disulfide oxidoreductase (DUF899 family)